MWNYATWNIFLCNVDTDYIQTTQNSVLSTLALSVLCGMNTLYSVALTKNNVSYEEVEC